jgi:uncharacterized protein
MVKFSLVPQEDKFFDLFVDGGRNVTKTALALKDLMDNWVDVEKKVAVISDLEHAGDTITHEIMALLHRSFITPFDREDIALLAHTIDDIVDLMHAAADAMTIYKIDKPTQRARELADIIVQASQQVELAMPYLRHRKELNRMLEYCIDINRLENEADHISRKALGELFEDQRDTAYIIKWREIYEHMENATDRTEDVANVLEGVALKNA